MDTEIADIEFNVQTWVPSEVDYVRESLTGGQQSANGTYSRQVRELLKAETGSAEVLLTTSCTSALELSAMLMDLEPGDTVIVPSFTFTTTALAFVRQGARLLFCDIEPRTLGLDPQHVAELLADPVHGPTVRAVVVVHYAGIACDVAGIREALADRPDVALVEDNAHGLFGRWRGEPLGSLGRFSTLSFHETKNISCGEGGALVLNDPGDVARSWIHYDKGTDRQAFMEGQVDKYSWRDTGSSFGLADPLAAILLAQLEEREVIQARRRAVFERYQAGLAEHAADLGLVLPDVPEDREPAYHLFHVLLPEAERRGEVIAAMKAKGVPTAFHYVPLHDSEGGRRFAAAPGECPTSTEVSARLLRLPFHQELEADDCEQVVTALVDVLSGR
ncbi:dTDP-4-amino-4,6-dideoxygalactose transaminase [Nocardioides renjunii]|uniref:dTDP-4-amino-4,6-dideoxygalactose transaminase n=1 Tax=Nocardioides renjunii TaxID=3095075 RepID=UPI002AFE4D74|nr:dTDP-4-amino-4,6-dideoxygalactose transaminase [Nocardioides sp. S-34]WQQ21254.1 dTDP-4-amino-4,6-dideoxygalactose transaminase [Nocardioides sp. S-34]